MNKTIQSRIFFRSVREPEIGKIYFQTNDNGESIEPCIIEDGTYLSNGRVSNFWYYLNLITGKRESNYGGFFELIQIDDEGEETKNFQTVLSRIYLKRIQKPEKGEEKIYFQITDGYTLEPYVIEGCEQVPSEVPPSKTVWHLLNLISGKREATDRNKEIAFWELRELE